MTVSIITAFYKGNEYIDKLLSSIQMNYEECKKNDIEIESIIVNDSPDYIIVCDKDNYKFRIQMIQNNENMGIHASRINGISHAKGQYIIMLDQDDVLTPHAIMSQVKAIDGNDVCVGNGLQVSNTKSRMIFKTERYHQCVTKLNVFLKFGTPIISPGQCLIRKDAIPDEWLQNIIHQNGADDEVLWILMHLQDSKFGINRADVYHHIDTGKNASDDFGKMADSSLEGVYLFEKQGKITGNQKKNYINRRMMKKERYGASIFRRVIINAKYGNLSCFVIRMKILQIRGK